VTDLRALNPPEMAAWHAFLHGHAAVIRKLEAELATAHGLSLPAYEVLAHLSEAPQRRMRMTELTRRALLTPSGVTRLVDKLERDGLVLRQRCDEDARAIYAVLTDAGLARLEEAYPTHLRGVREHLVDRLPCEQLPVIAEALHRLVDEPDCC
jgi:DNA-binding MarR family transcriptional regulator